MKMKANIKPFLYLKLVTVIYLDNKYMKHNVNEISAILLEIGMLRFSIVLPILILYLPIPSTFLPCCFNKNKRVL